MGKKAGKKKSQLTKEGRSDDKKKKTNPLTSFSSPPHFLLLFLLFPNTSTHSFMIFSSSLNIPPSSHLSSYACKLKGKWEESAVRKELERKEMTGEEHEAKSGGDKATKDRANAERKKRKKKEKLSQYAGANQHGAGMLTELRKGITSPEDSDVMLPGAAAHAGVC